MTDKKRSYAACRADHCAMDILLEEIYSIDNAEALVIGVGECSFYSRKLEFPDGRKNWAYELSDSEIVFGDITGIRKAVIEMSRPDKILVCIVTCIPALMNAELLPLEDEFPNLRIFYAPDFKNESKEDLISRLHAALCAPNGR